MATWVDNSGTIRCNGPFTDRPGVNATLDFDQEDPRSNPLRGQQRVEGNIWKLGSRRVGGCCFCPP